MPQNHSFIISKGAHNRLKIALISIFSIFLYYRFHGFWMENAHEHVLLVPIYTFLKSAIFKKLIVLAFALAQSVFYYELLVQFRKRGSKVQILCGLIIVLLFSRFFLGFISPTLSSNAAIYVRSLIFNLKDFITLLLSIFFIMRYRGYARLAGIAAVLSVVLPNLFPSVIAAYASMDTLNTSIEIVNSVTTFCAFLSYLFYFKSFKPEE